MSRERSASCKRALWRKLKHVVGLGSPLPCLYTNGIKTRRRWKACVQSEGCELTGVTMTWWDSSNGWSAAVEGYRLGGTESSWKAWSSALGWGKERKSFGVEQWLKRAWSSQRSSISTILIHCILDQLACK